MRFPLVILALIGSLARGQVISDESIDQRRRGLTVRCNGRVEQRTIDFEKARGGDLFRSGDTPRLLPDGVSVVAKRFISDRQLPPTTNDAVVIDSHDYYHEDGLVLAINNNNDRSDPSPSRFGGDIKFNFGSPVLGIDKIRLMGIQKSEKSFITARTGNNGKLGKVVIPSGEVVDLLLGKKFLDVKTLSIRLRASAVVARVVYSVCIRK